jgi:hypothetical protein
MRFKTPTGRFKEIPIQHYRVDWAAPQGSQFSREVLMFFYPYWRHDVVLAELPVAGTKMRYDFVNITRRIITESDGLQHDDPLNHFNRGSGAVWLAQIKRDALKDQCAAANGFNLIRIKPTDMPLSKTFLKRQFDIDL